ncbi:DUF1579 family protein [Gryllotalpicola ginsengisoli]|uniref:DUF1579 family protein n=1 Tax=Gryllotalpicola ginsengisoli TaxID=444608 RepID=UPI0003B4F994|nr:DUF1579 family protein [Gryllotalpicola ginsengisoli]
MADGNNHRAASLPDAPDPALRRLEPLVGTWEISGSLVQGRVRFEWMTGGFYLVQHVELARPGRELIGVEYIGYDEDTGTLRSHFMDNHGADFTYTWDVQGRELYTWFGQKGSDNFFHGRFSQDGDRYDGAWQWPDGHGGTGGYSATGIRVGVP